MADLETDVLVLSGIETGTPPVERVTPAAFGWSVRARGSVLVSVEM
jgi:hypothetical protein